jgi:hypothetical protein
MCRAAECKTANRIQTDTIHKLHQMTRGGMWRELKECSTSHGISSCLTCDCKYNITHKRNPTTQAEGEKKKTSKVRSE